MISRAGSRASLIMLAGASVGWGCSTTLSAFAMRQIGPTVLELRETLRSLKQLSDKLGASDSLLLGRDQPREFQPQ